MTKTKRNLILVVSLLFAIFTLCSVFAGVSFHTPQTVEAAETLTDEQLQYRRDNPGLYETGTTTLIKDGENDMTWDYLLSNGPFTFEDGHLRPDQLTGRNLPGGDLVCGKVDGLTDLSYGFGWCEEITGVDLTNLETSNVTDMSWMFIGCKKLKEIDLSGLDTSKVEVMANMFLGCEILEKVTFGNQDVSKVKNIDWMFYNCKNLVSLDLSWMDTSSITNMSRVFYGCSSLTNLNLQNWNTKGVFSLSGMFSGCKSLTSLDVSGFDTSGVWEMSEMFSGCESLSELDLRNFKTEKVESMEGMFNSCHKLKTLDLGSFNTESVSNMSKMFYNCGELTSLDVTGFNTGRVTKMTQMFAGCKKLKNLDVSGFDTGEVISMAGMFSRCESLTSLNVSNFVTTNVNDMREMFANMKSLKTLDVSNFEASRVLLYCWMFSGTNLTEIDLRKFDFSYTHRFLGGVNAIGLLGMGDDNCIDFLKQMDETAAVTAYQKAMNNEDISYDLEELDGEIADLYKQEIVGKTGDGLGHAGKICVAGYGLSKSQYVESREKEIYLDLARGMFETKIGKIYLPATASSVNISLPSNTTYVAKSGDTEFEVEQQILYGYNDLNKTAGTVLVAKTADVENTGVVLDTKTIIIVCAIAGACVLAIIAVVLNKVYKANKRKNRKF